MKTTLSKIKSHRPCEDSWKLLLKSLGKTKADDTEVSIKYILDLLGVEDAIWSLRAVEGHEREIRLFACDCAESVLHIFEEKYPKDKRLRKAVKVSRLYAEGKASIKELSVASAAANDAFDDAWDDATAVTAAMAAMDDPLGDWAAAHARAAIDARFIADARLAAIADERKKQEKYLRKYL